MASPPPTPRAAAAAAPGLLGQLPLRTTHSHVLFPGVQTPLQQLQLIWAARKEVPGCPGGGMGAGGELLVSCFGAWEAFRLKK